MHVYDWATQVGMNPKGNSPETHRLAEYLSHGTVPAMLENEFIRAPFQDVPGIIGADWDEVVTKMKFIFMKEHSQHLASLQERVLRFGENLHNCMVSDMDMILREAMQLDVHLRPITEPPVVVETVASTTTKPSKKTKKKSKHKLKLNNDENRHVVDNGEGEGCDDIEKLSQLFEKMCGAADDAVHSRDRIKNMLEESRKHPNSKAVLIGTKAWNKGSMNMFLEHGSPRQYAQNTTDDSEAWPVKVAITKTEKVVDSARICDEMEVPMTSCQDISYPSWSDAFEMRGLIAKKLARNAQTSSMQDLKNSFSSEEVPRRHSEIPPQNRQSAPRIQ